MPSFKRFLQVSGLVGALSYASGCQSTDFRKTSDGGFELTVTNKLSDDVQMFSYSPATKMYPADFCGLGVSGVEMGQKSADLVIADFSCNKEAELVLIKYGDNPKVSTYIFNQKTKRLENADPSLDNADLTTKVDKMLKDFYKEHGIDRLIKEAKGSK